MIMMSEVTHLGGLEKSQGRSGQGLMSISGGDNTTDQCFWANNISQEEVEEETKKSEEWTICSVWFGVVGEVLPFQQSHNGHPVDRERDTGNGQKSRRGH